MRPRTLLTIVVAAVCLAAFLPPHARGAASTIFFDDFEDDTAATFWVDGGTDADPVTPVIGPNWDTPEVLVPHEMQVVNFPHDISGPPWAPGNAGPTWSASPTGGNQYLHMFGYFTFYHYASAPITAAAQAQIASDAFLRLDVETFALSGADGWDGGLRITGWDGAVNASPRAFDVLLMKDGSVLNNTSNDVYGIAGDGAPYPAGFNVVPGLTHDVNTWENLSIVTDFATDTFAITLDGVTVGGLTWNGGDLSKIQNVTLALPAQSDPRGGYDNFSLFVPEPAAGALTLLACGAALGRRRHARA